MAARKQPKNGRPWHPDRVRERIRVGLLVTRLEKQALGLMEGHEVIKVPMVKDGELQLDAAGEPRYESRLRSTAMTSLQYAAAVSLIDRCIPKAEAPRQLEINGNITVVDRDPTARPPGYQRKGRAS